MIIEDTCFAASTLSFPYARIHPQRSPAHNSPGVAYLEYIAILTIANMVIITCKNSVVNGVRPESKTLQTLGKASEQGKGAQERKRKETLANSPIVVVQLSGATVDIGWPLDDSIKRG
jgi:hypothetical protein